jgi:hypothetical protein
MKPAHVLVSPRKFSAQVGRSSSLNKRNRNAFGGLLIEGRLGRHRTSAKDTLIKEAFASNRAAQTRDTINIVDFTFELVVVREFLVCEIVSSESTLIK